MCGHVKLDMLSPSLRDKHHTEIDYGHVDPRSALRDKHHRITQCVYVTLWACESRAGLRDKHHDVYSHRVVGM